ncbi:MAG: hypothetical protein JW863_14570 [Chitinispirillaceae bacterium]|nr:hypothetical protein [Chitinispirillaceae bacterium]
MVKLQVSLHCIVFLLVMSVHADDMSRKSFGFTPLTASGIDDYEATVFNQQLRNEIEKIGLYSILEFSEIQTRLAEQGLPNSCSDLHCAVVAGQLLGVEYFGFGSIGKVGKTYIMSMQLVEVRTGRIIRDLSEFFKGKRSAFRQKIIPRFATRICGLEYEKK